jgi:hypothetical protein
VNDAIVNYAVVTEAMKTFFSVALPGGAILPVTISGAPTELVDDLPVAIPPPFVEIEHLPDGRDPQGGWAQPWALVFCKYQLLSVGNTPEASAHLDHFAVQRFAARNPNGIGSLNPIPIDGHVCIGREVVSRLGYAKSGRSTGTITHIRVQVQVAP